MMVVLMKILQVILALSILIVIHEFGHFTFAKLFGIRVDKFFLFLRCRRHQVVQYQGEMVHQDIPESEGLGD